jgi:hypothetical protein
MDGVSLPYIPISLWLLAGAMTILILLVAFGFYVYWRKWAIDLAETGSGVASLAARKLILEKDVESLREWIETQRAELDRFKAEREEQERLRAVLADLEHQCATKNQENQGLRNEVGELENQRHHLTQALLTLKREIGDLDAKRAEKEALESLLAQLRPQVEESQKTVHNLAAMTAMLNALTSEKEALERAVEDLRATGESARTETDRLRNDAVQARIELEQIARELSDARNQKAELDATINQHRHAQHTLKGDIQHLEQKIEDIKASAQKAMEELQRHAQEAQHAKAEAERAAAEAEQEKRGLELLLKDRQRVEIELGEMNGRKPLLERAIDDLRSDAELARAEADRLRSEAGQARTEADQVARELADAQRERAELDVILDTLRQEQHALEGSAERLEQRIEDLKQEIDDLDAKARKAKANELEATQQLQQTNAAVERAARELGTIVKERQGEEWEIGGLNAQKASLKQEIIQLEKERNPRPDGDGDPLAPYVDLINEAPACLADDRFAGGPLTSMSEEEALQKLQEMLTSDGLFFSERVLNAFHTSLKVNDIIPLTVLAGVSGTGKSLLPVKYAEGMGMYSLIVSVQPRWDSPQDLFGFYNYLEHKYKATDLARALVRMDEFNFTPDQFSALKGKKRSERILLVLLDEMNLARTEYYFSEFLSKLEFRKFSKDPSKRSQAEIVLDTGPRSKDVQPFRLWVGGNVLFVGTMNEDESTQTLSDKVLDRANVLRFGKPPEKDKRDEKGEKRREGIQCYLPYSLWESWIREPGIESWRRSVDSLLSRLNDALNVLGRPFGYRVQDAVHTYVANYPGMLHNGKLHKTALADQIELKLLPKLRGVEVSENAQPLNRIEEVIQELGDENKMLLDQFRNCRQQAQNTTNLFAWRGVEHPL